MNLTPSELCKRLRETKSRDKRELLDYSAKTIEDLVKRISLVEQTVRRLNDAEDK